MIINKFHVVSGMIRDNFLAVGTKVNDLSRICKYPWILDRIRVVTRARSLSDKTEDCYHNFIKRYILFHEKRRPEEMGAEEISIF